MVRHILVQN